MKKRGEDPSVDITRSIIHPRFRVLNRAATLPVQLGPTPYARSKLPSGGYKKETQKKPAASNRRQIMNLASFKEVIDGIHCCS